MSAVQPPMVTPVPVPPAVAPVLAKKPPQKKSMAKQKDATGRCAVRPQRVREIDEDGNPKGRPSKGDLIDLYVLLYARVPFDNPSDVALARGFSDKELRVLMGMNKMLINDYNPTTGKYTEKTKKNKIVALLPNLKSLARPEDLAKPKKPKRSSKAKQAAAAAAAVAAAAASPPVPPVQPPMAPAPVVPTLKVPPAAPPTPAPAPIAMMRPPAPAPVAPVAVPRRQQQQQHQTAGKIVTPLSLPRGTYEDEVANASGYACAAMALHFSNCCAERRDPCAESAATIEAEVLRLGVERYNQNHFGGAGRQGGEQSSSTRMDEVVADEFLGQSLRIVDVCAFSRSLRYPSTLEIVISKLQQAPGTMATFLYGHESFSDVERAGSILFLGYHGMSSRGEVTFVVMDPRSCNRETGLPSRSGSPTLMVMLSAADMHQYLMALLQGEGGTDTRAVDWQASFLEIKPAESPAQPDSWMELAADTPAIAQIPAPAAVPLPLSDVVGRDSMIGRLSVDNSCSEMDALQQSMQRNSLDDDDTMHRGSLDDLALQDSLAASMQRNSLDDLEFLQEPLQGVVDTPSLEHSVQQAIQQETTAQQSKQAAWQAEMSARMLHSRQEHERSQRLRQHAPAEAALQVSTPPEEGKRKRQSLTTHFGGVFRRNSRKNKGDDKFVSRHSVEDEEEPTSSSAAHGLQQAIVQAPVAAPEVHAMPVSKEFKSLSGDTSRYIARREDRTVVLEVAPTGVTVIDGDSTFYHLTTILSWRVRRLDSGAPVGFKLVFTDGSDIIFGTEQGREISDVLMKHAQGLASLMQSGMHVRGTAMVN
jgi:hypothetical protein